MPQAKHKPYIRKLQGQILVPYNCTTTTDSETGDTLYSFSLFRHAPGHPIDDLTYWIEKTWRQLNAELQHYISQYYGQGVQSTINGYASRALSDGRDDIVAECRKVQDWIDSVLDYYDSQKSAIMAAVTEDERMMVTWDFAGNVPLTEYVDWREIKAMFTT